MYSGLVEVNWSNVITILYVNYIEENNDSMKMLLCYMSEQVKKNWKGEKYKTIQKEFFFFE